MARTIGQVDLAMRVALWIVSKHWNLGMLGLPGIERDLPWMYEEVAEMMFGPDASDTRTVSNPPVRGAHS